MSVQKVFYLGVIIMALQMPTIALPVGHWDFNNIKSGVVKDLSGNNHDGTIYGNPEVVDGLSGKALRFKTNDDYVDFKKPLIPKRDFSISVKINFDDLKAQFFLGQYKYAAPDRFDLVIRNGKVRWHLGDFIDSTTTIKAQTWYHIIYVRGNGVLQVFLDGEKITEKQNKQEVIQDEPLILGKIFVPNKNGFRFTGMIDDLKIWDHALSESEIKAELAALKN